MATASLMISNAAPSRRGTPVSHRTSARRIPAPRRSIVANQASRDLRNPVKYLSEAAAQIFKPFMSGDKVEWKTTPFSGRISHHDQKPRRSERGMHKILEEAVEEIDVVNPNGEVSNTLKHVMNANFKSSTDEGEPESYGGQHGFSGDVPRRRGHE
mmetsp:Transcript_38570/g.109078  ORF Transcript_38570/g.109078 Transcript_38570/m.109078 type:complete len:156 (+) Transcript_38570:161-628(+)